MRHQFLPDGERRSHNGFWAWILAFATVLLPVAVLWFETFRSLDKEYELSERGAIENSGNLARGFAEDVRRIIEDTDQVLLLLRKAHAVDPDRFDPRAMAAANQLAFQISTTDVHGIVTGSNLPLEDRVDLSDREHIRVQLDNPEDSLFISKPVLGRVSNKWSIQLTRKMYDRAGAVSGVIVASLDPYYLSQFYNSLDIGSGAVSLAGVRDHIIRARSPVASNAIGKPLPDAAIKGITAGGTSGHQKSVSGVDGVERIVSFRRLDRFGLVVTVGLATDDVFAAYRANVRLRYFNAGVLSIFFLLAGYLILRQARVLDRSRIHMAVTLDNISEGIVLIDKSGFLPILNRRMLRLIGADVSWRRLSYWDIVERLRGSRPESDGEDDILTAMRAAGKQTSIDECPLPGGGTAEVRTQLLADGSAVQTYTDITARKAAEAALRETLARFYSMMSGLGSSILIVTQDGRIEFANQAFCDLFGIESGPETLPGQNARDFLGRLYGRLAFPRKIYDRLVDMVEEGKPVFRRQFRLAGGRTVLQDFIPIVVEGKPLGRMWHHVDVTELKRTEQELRNSEHLKGSILSSAPDGIITMDETFSIIEFNKAAEAMFGRTRADVAGRRLADLIQPSAGSAVPPLRAAVNAVLEINAARADGHIFPAEITITPTHLEDREIFTAFVRDITIRKQAEESLRESQKLEALGQLTGGLAHDFNNLIGIIIGNLDLAAGLVHRDVHLQAVLNAALRGAEVTRSLMAVARRQPMQMEAHDVNALVASMVPLSRVSLGGEISIRTQLWPSALNVWLDAAGLSNVLLNLLINARDAMKGVEREKIVAIRVRREAVVPGANPRLRPGDYAVLSVQDTGCGMSEDVRARAFEPFFTTKERGTGTGLGLAMVRGYAEQLGGQAEIESEVGAGTKVTLYLRLDDERMRAIDAAEHDRLAALLASGLTRLDNEKALEDLSAAAAEVCQAPMGFFGFVDEARLQIAGVFGGGMADICRSDSFCAHAIQRPDEIMIVEDARTDMRFSANPLVVGDPFIVFYAGVPLVDKEQRPLGVLCVIDHVPRALTSAQKEKLLATANRAAQHIGIGPCVRGKQIVESSPTEIPPVEIAPRAPRRRILVVDDEAALCEYVCEMLDDCGYEPVGVNTPGDALAHLAAEPFDILFSDILMPGPLNGVALARRAVDVYPGLKVLLASGFAPDSAGLGDQKFPFLTKPYRRADLLAALEKLSPAA